MDEEDEDADADADDDWDADGTDAAGAETVGVGEGVGVGVGVGDGDGDGATAGRAAKCHSVSPANHTRAAARPELQVVDLAALVHAGEHVLAAGLRRRAGGGRTAEPPYPALVVPPKLTDSTRTAPLAIPARATTATVRVLDFMIILPFRFQARQRPHCVGTVRPGTMKNPGQMRRRGAR